MLEPVIYAKRGGWAPSTEFGFMKIAWDRSIQEELAGQSPSGNQSWKEFWHDRYRAIRHWDEPAFAEQEVTYIHQQRQHYGLPIYDER